VLRGREVKPAAEIPAARRCDNRVSGLLSGSEVPFDVMTAIERAARAIVDRGVSGFQGV
jgi:hypothetical protein